MVIALMCLLHDELYPAKHAEPKAVFLHSGRQFTIYARKTCSLEISRSREHCHEEKYGRSSRRVSDAMARPLNLLGIVLHNLLLRFSLTEVRPDQSFINLDSRH